MTDYNGDLSLDPDIDGDDANDWIMYVDLVEQRRSRDCDTSGFPAWTATPSPTPTPAPCTPDGTGLRGLYYLNPPPDPKTGFSQLVSVTLDPEIAFASTTGTWNPDIPPIPAGSGTYNYFSAKWLGQLLAEDAGTYTLCTYSDDGSRIYIDGNLYDGVNWGDHGMREHCGAGIEFDYCSLHDIEVQFYENTGGAGIYLRWIPPGGAKVTVPQDHLYPDPNMPPTVTPTAVPTDTPTPPPTPTASPTPPCSLDGDGLLAVYYAGLPPQRRIRHRYRPGVGRGRRHRPQLGYRLASLGRPEGLLQRPMDGRY